MHWTDSFREDPYVRLAAKPGLAEHAGGTFPTCSRHGLMLEVGDGSWLCDTCRIRATWVRRVDAA
jgi:hypothetical protein